MTTKTKTYCENIRERLAEHGAPELRSDSDAQEHLTQCAECFSFLEALEEIDSLLVELPSIDPGESIQQLVLERVQNNGLLSEEVNGLSSENAAAQKGHSAGFSALRRLWKIMVNVVTFPTKCVSKIWQLLKSVRNGYRHLFSPRQRLGIVSTTSLFALLVIVHRATSPLLFAGSFEPFVDNNFSESSPAFRGTSSQLRVGTEQAESVGRYKTKSSPDTTATNSNFLDSISTRPASPSIAGDTTDYRAREYGDSDLMDVSTPESLGSVGKEGQESLQKPGFQGLSPRQLAGAAASLRTEEKKHANLQPDLAWKSSPTPMSRQNVGKSSRRAQSTEELSSSATALEQFLAGRQRVEGLTFKEASGYWANTYLPGDPTLRQLSTALRYHDKHAFESAVGTTLALHETARQLQQPFDSPKNSALAVYLHSDKTAIQSTTRMLLQVGLKGSERRSGNRGAMNIAVVLDARSSLTRENLAKVKELLLALNIAKDIGDKFSLFIAGATEASVLSADQFTHGRLTVELQDLATAKPTASSLADVVEEAIISASSSDDPNSPLGTSLVLVITAQTFGPEAQRLATLAHRSSVAGISVSAIGVGEAINHAELDQLALSGQGSRRVFKDGVEAKKLIEDELFAASRVVARAVRLRIRLAPGVKLVDVIGSYPLDAQHAARVREAEQSIDRRLARNLGIEADRGEDEEGIQIVIPAYYSGDEHVILLDVVAEQAGAIADVTVRYKDLVYLTNGVSRANLSLGSDSVAQGNWGGPLERNVVKNLLTIQLAEKLSYAGNQLEAGNRSAAVAALNSYRSLLAELQSKGSGFERDREIATDMAMVQSYVQMLELGGLGSRRLDYELIDSLAYAGKLKILPEPKLLGSN